MERETKGDIERNRERERGGGRRKRETARKIRAIPFEREREEGRETAGDGANEKERVIEKE